MARAASPMADRLDVAETWRKMMEANLRYYEGLIGLSADYLGAVLGTLGQFRLPQPAVRQPAASGGAPAAAPDVHVHSPAPALVLEAQPGRAAMGAFLVENHLAERVVAPIVTSAFRDPAGREVRPQLRFDPESIALNPGEQILVRVAAAIDAGIEAGTTYRGEVSIPGLSNSRVRLAIRRRQVEPPPTAARVRQPSPSAGRARRRTPKPS